MKIISQKEYARIIQRIETLEQTAQALTGLDTPGNPIDELSQRLERIEGLAVLRGQLAAVVHDLRALYGFVKKTSTHEPPPLTTPEE